MRNKVYRKIKYVIFSFLWIIIPVLVFKLYIYGIFKQPDGYFYPQDKISGLEEQIKKDNYWINFKNIFNGYYQESPFPNYFKKGVSSPVFLLAKNAGYFDGSSIDIWLLAKIKAEKKRVLFNRFVLMARLKKNNNVLACYELTSAQTSEIMSCESKDDFIKYLEQKIIRL